MDYTNYSLKAYTLEQLIEMQNEICSEINLRKRALKLEAEKEVTALLDRVNELQNKYNIIICADDEDCDKVYISDLRVVD